MPELFVVATPIGNLQDLSPRALSILRSADLILAEDTRVTRKLLTALDVKTPLESCHEHNEAHKSADIIRRMLEADLVVALVTDAGTPAVSDPGARVVRSAHEANIRVTAVPGPSAFAAALSVCGFEETEFTFCGFLPRKKTELLNKLRAMSGFARLAVIYESPHRILALLEAIGQVYPDAEVSVSREISKVHEQTLKGTAKELHAQFESAQETRRGEFCLVLRVPETGDESQESEAPTSLEAKLTDRLLEGLSPREAMDRLTALGEKRNRVYQAWLNLKRMADGMQKGGDEDSAI